MTSNMKQGLAAALFALLAFAWLILGGCSWTRLAPDEAPPSRQYTEQCYGFIWSYCYELEHTKENRL